MPRFLCGAALCALIALPAFADITVTDAYARVASPVAKSGATFMVLRNSGDSDDRLVAARTDSAARTELHTHIENDGGIMQMREIEDGVVIPAGGDHALMRGGDHLMMMGLTGPLRQGDRITVTLTFERAGEMTITVPVDNDRKAHGH